MATSSRATPPPRRTSVHSPPNPSVPRGTSARSTSSPKSTLANGVSRRGSIKGSPARTGNIADDIESSSRDVLLSSLKREVEEKEQLLVRIQQGEQTVSALTSENDALSNNLNATESRLTDLYTEQSRMEEDLAARLELVERLRAQVQELEREKRDILRRYNEQTATFDAERQSFYDNEQHLKSRIQSLVQARRSANLESSTVDENDGPPSAKSEENEIEQALEDAITITQPPSPHQKVTITDEADELPEMISLRLELSTLSTSYASLQTTVQMLSTQLLDLKRVNNQLQEENESYNILLREKTLSGRFDILKTVGTEHSEDEVDSEESEDDAVNQNFERSSVRSGQKSILEPVAEAVEDLDSNNSVFDHLHFRQDTDSSSMADDDRPRRQGRVRRTGAVSPSSQGLPLRGESLADLPITGPGLDLAAELGRAENLAILEGADVPDLRDRSATKQKKIIKKASMDKKISDVLIEKTETGDLDALRNEVKSLKDANKALSLYASKIIDRIIAQEGFEHVLAVDYEKSSNTAVAKNKQSTKDTNSPAEMPAKKRRPQSSFFSGLSTPETIASSVPTSPIENTSTTKAQRRSLSFDWKPFSVWGSTDKKADAGSSLKSLTLRPGSVSVVNARKLETQEDEEDRKERERMNATLKLMGIEKPSLPNSPAPMLKSYSSPGTTPDPNNDRSSPRPVSSKFPFFRSKSASDSPPVSVNRSLSDNESSVYLTEEALEHAEAATVLMALDAKEKVLSEEIAQGFSGGFTELPPRRRLAEERRSRSKRTSGSGSTVWSAGMSNHREDWSGEE